MINSFSVFAFTTVGTIVFGKLAISRASRRSLRIKIACICVVYFLYSGLGLAFDASAAKYLSAYFIFLLSLLAGLLLGAGSFASSTQKSNAASNYYRGGLPPVPSAPTSKADRKEKDWWSPSTARLLCMAFLLCTILQLILSGALLSLFHPASVILDAHQAQDIFLGRLARVGSTLYSLAGLVKLVATPFFYIELQRNFAGRWITQLFILVAITYVEIATAEQWGRVTLIKPFLVWATILLFHRRVTGRAFIAIAVGIFLLLVPSLNAIAEWRGGSIIAEQRTFSEQVTQFRESEFSYPSNYPLTEKMGEDSAYSARYLKWLATLPVPRALTGTSFSITKEYSEYVLGIPYGKPGFYVLLPSWLGEAIIGFGTTLCGIWGLVVGLVIGQIDRLVTKSQGLVTFDAFLTALLIIYLRSVSQEYLAQAVNSLWVLAALYLLRRTHGEPGRAPARLGRHQAFRFNGASRQP